MDIEFPEEIGKSAINFFSTKVFESVIKWFRKKPTGDTGKQKDENTAEHIWIYYNELSTWSRSIEFLMPLQRLRKDIFSIPLEISFNVRKLSPEEPRAQLISERELLTQKGHYLLLGDPGSGKTTTLKQLVAHFFLPMPIYPPLLHSPFW